MLRPFHNGRAFLILCDGNDEKSFTALIYPFVASSKV
jgi:hypothetical protein